MGLEPKVKPPFGGGNLTQFFSPDDPWEALSQIAIRLKAGEPIDPELAAWLHHAIKKSGRKPNELLRGLGLLKKKGRPNTPLETWLPWGQRIVELEEEGNSPKFALQTVIGEIKKATGAKRSPYYVQRWRDWYRKARDVEWDV